MVAVVGDKQRTRRGHGCMDGGVISLNVWIRGESCDISVLTC
jgi:hypothetical protein